MRWILKQSPGSYRKLNICMTNTVIGTW
jgi:hypothetical protein